MTSNYSSNLIYNHYGGSSMSSRGSLRQRFSGSKCFCRMLTKVNYSTLVKNPGKTYYNCPNFSSGCEYFVWSENYREGEEEDNSAKVRDLYDELVIQLVARKEECDDERKKGTGMDCFMVGQFGFLCGVLVSILLVPVFFEVVVW